MEPYDILNVMNSLVKSVHFFMEYTMHRLGL